MHKGDILNQHRQGRVRTSDCIRHISHVRDSTLLNNEACRLKKATLNLNMHEVELRIMAS
jgi:hypothetical protein